MMKAVRTVRETQEMTYAGSKKPKHKVGDYMRIYCGSQEGCHFYIKDVRYNHDIQRFEYSGGGFYGWRSEGTIVYAGDRKGWHYDSQGYCDNPGRGY